MTENINLTLLERSRVPLSVQIAALLRKRLMAGEWRLGDRVPTLEEFMQEYGVSRVTVRTALADLEKEGLIDRGRGRGTFVSRDISEDHWLILPTDWQGLVAHIEQLNARVQALSSGERMPVLQPGDGRAADRYWGSTRVNWSEQLPYSLAQIYLEWQMREQLPAALDEAAVLPLLAKSLRSRLAAFQQTLTISTADLELAKHLHREVGEPIVQVRRAITDTEGVLVYLAIVQYPAMYLRIETEVRL